MLLQDINLINMKKIYITNIEQAKKITKLTITLIFLHNNNTMYITVAQDIQAHNL